MQNLSSEDLPQKAKKTSLRISIHQNQKTPINNSNNSSPKFPIKTTKAVPKTKPRTSTASSNFSFFAYFVLWYDIVKIIPSFSWAPIEVGTSLPNQLLYYAQENPRQRIPVTQQIRSPQSPPFDSETDPQFEGSSNASRHLRQSLPMFSSPSKFWTLWRRV